jgi:hypothetical protein
MNLCRGLKNGRHFQISVLAVLVVSSTCGRKNPGRAAHKYVRATILAIIHTK